MIRIKERAGAKWPIILSIFTAMMTLMLISGGLVGAGSDPVILKGSIGEEIQYQKSIEAVAFGNDTFYVSCDYRMVLGRDIISVYYLGLTGAYALNGTRLWVNDSGYVVKLQPVEGGIVAGSMGGFVFFNSKGQIKATTPVKNKLYDFVMRDGIVYGVDGDVWYSQGNFSSGGEVFEGRLLNNGSIEVLWSLNLSSMPSRVRLGDVIYVGSGFPSGYSGKFRFGSVYGVSYGGKLLWNVRVGEWVRDLEVWKGNALVGTGFNNTAGRILIIGPDGEVLWNTSAFFVEDLLVDGDVLYVSGLKNGSGVVTAYNLKNKKELWEVSLPYRAKVMAYWNGKLAVGTGKFESKKEGNTTEVYSEGGLYVLDASSGKILWENTGTGYIRSMALKDKYLLAGTGSSYFYLIDLSKISSDKGICGPAFVLVFALVPIVVGRVRVHGR